MFGLWGSLSAFGGYGGPGACYRPFGPIRPRGFVVGQPFRLWRLRRAWRVLSSLWSDTPARFCCGVFVGEWGRSAPGVRSGQTGVRTTDPLCGRVSGGHGRTGWCCGCGGLM